MIRLPSTNLPHSLAQALWRGIRGKCPRCEGAALFDRFLKPVPRCRVCGQDWSLQRADDFPPYIAIIITGHVMAPVLVEIGRIDRFSTLTLILMTLIPALIMIIGLLQPSKGGVIALQWWMGMHGFIPSGRDEAADSAQQTAQPDSAG